MSSRALRKLQREQELRKQVAAAKEAYDKVEDSDEDEEDNGISTSQTQRPINTFDMLEQVEDEQDSDAEDDDVVVVASKQASSTPAEPLSSQPAPPSKSKKKKKKKQKRKAKDKPSGTPQLASQDVSEDEIDKALKEINERTAAGRTNLDDQQEEENWEASAAKVLAVEPKNLNPVNEMKSLFGSIAVQEDSSRSRSQPQRRREQNLQGGVDLGTALTGRYNIASHGKQLGSLASRRNVFVQGKEEWPLATSGGLSMERVAEHDGPSFESRYNILHNENYDEAQRQFYSAVQSMNPEAMIHLLMINPYHIATLLQVSEIAKHQGDHSVSGDLLERALFSLGRSVHSSFPAALRQGTARVRFDTSENRELYLAIWRHIRNLEMRGTWRTAYEWAKILYQLNTISDPYGVTLFIDQLALRGRQHVHFIDMCSIDMYGAAWQHLPNITISLALAYQRAGRGRDARRQLAIAMHHYPYILSELASTIEISPMPKSLWGKIPATDAEKLYSQLYATRAKDLWILPEASQLLVEVSETLEHYSAAIESSPPPAKLEISFEDARHIMLLEIPALIALLPKKFTTMPTSSYDVLPPPSSTAGFTTRAPASAPTSVVQTGILQRILEFFQPVQRNSATDDNSNPNERLLTQLPAELQRQLDNLPPDLVEDLLMHQLDDGEDVVGNTNLNMAGGWGASDDDDDIVPGLEGEDDSDEHHQIPSTQNSTNPHAATVEEDISDDEPHTQTTSTSRSILRHIDSDDEDEHATPRRAPATSTTNPTTTSPSDLSAQSPETLDENDPQRLQRWLITTGLTDLQSNPNNLGVYIRRMKLLRKQQQEWIVGIVKQRGGKDLAEKVTRALS